jgi:SAM-dependent methyltransferase
MLGMAEEPDSSFLAGRIVADFGCGPRGSLAWATDAALRIGIDVLADRYCDEFTGDALSHGMVYLKSTEKVIPLPDGLVDVMFTLNAIDHVDDFPRMCSEIVRVIRRGGLFIGSFNLEEPAGPTEPQRLDERLIEEQLLRRLEVQSYRLTAKPEHDDIYAPFFGELLPYQPGEEGYLWVRAVKP